MICTLSFHHALPIFYLCSTFLHGNHLEKAPGKYQPYQSKDTDDHCSHKQESKDTSLRRTSQLIQRIPIGLQTGSYFRGLIQDAQEHIVSFHIEVIICSKKSQRQYHSHCTLILHMGTDQSHHPSQCTGKTQNKKRKNKGQQKAQDHANTRNTANHKPHQQCRDHDDELIHQPHQIHSSQSGQQDAGCRKRHGKQKVIILRLI